MFLSSIKIESLRCFSSVELELSPGINLLVGKNNSGKSTLVRAIHTLQVEALLKADDIRANEEKCTLSYEFKEPHYSYFFEGQATAIPMLTAGVRLEVSTAVSAKLQTPWRSVKGSTQALINEYPRNFIRAILANRKTAGFEESINLTAQKRADGTLGNLYAKVDMLGAGHPDHDAFTTACRAILGMQVTAAPSTNGKKAGFYFDRNNFVSLDRMGDGIASLLGLIVELVTASKCLFLIEEPENDLHPEALKNLLRLLGESSKDNQFVISTHSNIVVRSLGALSDTKIFDISHTHGRMSDVTEVPNTPASHHELLSSLGYDFSDFGLWKGWLFLEESSAEEIIAKYLIPWFTPSLKGLLRTYSAGGVTNLEPRLDDFHRLFVFLHLQPQYSGRIWIIADGDSAGTRVTEGIRTRFSIGMDRCISWSKENFEDFYPEKFKDQTIAALKLSGEKKRTAKAELLIEIKQWAKSNPTEAKLEFSKSAREVIDLMRNIEAALKEKEDWSE